MPDLIAARATMEAVFDADGTRCTIRSDPEKRSDDLFNETTGILTPPDPDETTVYTGPCLIRPVQGLGQDQRDEGGTAQFIDVYRLRLPADVATIAIGQVATIDEAPNDSQMVGREFIVRKVLGGSYAVSRILLVEARVRGPRI